MKKNIPIVFLFLLLLIMNYGCFREEDPDTILDRHCSFYRPDYATIKIAMECKYFGGDSLEQIAVIKIYNWSPDGKLIVNDLDGGRLLINGQETEFRDSLNMEGFFPVDRNFKIVPGNQYTVVFEHDSSTYEFTTTIPPRMDDLVMSNVVNMNSDLRLRLWNDDNYHRETKVRLIAYDPNDLNDTLFLINDEVYKGSDIFVPFTAMAPALYGWKAELYVRRIDEGSYDSRFLNDSEISGVSSYFRKFNLTYSKSR